MSFVEINSRFVRISELSKEKITELCMIDYSQFSINDLLSLSSKLGINTNVYLNDKSNYKKELVCEIIEKLRSISETSSKRKHTNQTNKSITHYNYQQVCFL